MNRISLFLLASVLLVQSSGIFAGQELQNLETRSEEPDFTTLQGEWEGQTYLLVLHRLWEDVQGSWGDHRKYSLAWDPYESRLKGRSAGVAQEMAIDDLWGEVRGEALCGDFDFTYSKKEPYRVEGLFCHNMIERFFESEETMKSWIKESMLRQMVIDFPEPTKVQVYEFLDSMVRFERLATPN